MKRSVLVVDDQPMVREVLKSMLEARGISVAVAKDGAEALERFAADSIPAVVIDVDMPGPNGVEVCRAVRAFAADHRRPVAVWLMTGVERPDSWREHKQQAPSECSRNHSALKNYSRGSKTCSAGSQQRPRRAHRSHIYRPNSPRLFATPKR
jgi:CheY-like chemotaxis protein